MGTTLEQLRISDKFDGQRYDVVAWANDQETVYYEEFGSYQGEWVLVSRDLSQYFIYKGWYGSCSGCDSYEASLSYGENVGKEAAKKFAEDYRSFLEIPNRTMMNLSSNRSLLSVFPANVRDTDEADMASVASAVEMRVRLIHGMDISAEDIISTRNQEVQQECLKIYGYERFCKDTGAKIIGSEKRPYGTNELLEVEGNIKFASVIDASTGNRYLLRVPPDISSIKEAIAWTFGMEMGEYNPIIET